MGEPPGTLAVIEPGDEAPTPQATSSADHERGDHGDAGDPGVPMVDAHSMSPDVVLATLGRLGGSVARIVIVGCQPADLREGMGLSPAVAAAIDDAVDLCLEVVTDLTTAVPSARPVHAFQGGTSP